MLVAEEAVEIRVLRRQGKSIRESARMLAVSRNTVRRYVRGDGLPHYERATRPGKLDHYKQYIAERVSLRMTEGSAACKTEEWTRIQTAVSPFSESWSLGHMR